MVEINTERLVLRDWRESDLAPWAAMNADPEVREYLGPLLTIEQAAASIRWFQDAIDLNGFGFWAVEIRASSTFIGFTGLDAVDEGLPFSGVEAGWRLARSAWGFGYATEAASAVLEFGFGEMGLPEIVAMTATTNVRSQAVMKRLGMDRDPADDFDHPEVDEAPLRRHVLYRKRADAEQPTAA